MCYSSPSRLQIGLASRFLGEAGEQATLQAGARSSPTITCLRRQGVNHRTDTCHHRCHSSYQQHTILCSHDANSGCTNSSSAMSTALNLGAWRDRTNLYGSPHATEPPGSANTASIDSSPTANHMHTTLQATVNQVALVAMTHTARVPAFWVPEMATAMLSSRWTSCLHDGLISRTT